ncbi:MAG: peptidylprolyl isomerase [Deltaproteobacteria bacterium]|nr:peptidylprolyl isomerase [Deltaproteobacteria bacterium]
MQTSRGDFTIRFNEDTPVTAYYFLKEAPNQKGRTFHRVVPNFVAQGGDPRGDGFGGPGYSVRDEISLRPHERGSVGIATAGKDTGGCQFFVDTAPNPHLLGRYTNFARVTSGIEVLDRMEPNDTILKIRVY